MFLNDCLVFKLCFKQLSDRCQVLRYQILTALFLRLYYFSEFESDCFFDTSNSSEFTYQFLACLQSPKLFYQNLVFFVLRSNLSKNKVDQSVSNCAAICQTTPQKLKHLLFFVLLRLCNFNWLILRYGYLGKMLFLFLNLLLWLYCSLLISKLHHFYLSSEPHSLLLPKHQFLLQFSYLFLQFNLILKTSTNLVLETALIGFLPL